MGTINFINQTMSPKVCIIIMLVLATSVITKKRELSANKVTVVSRGGASEERTTISAEEKSDFTTAMSKIPELSKYVGNSSLYRMKKQVVNGLVYEAVLSVKDGKYFVCAKIHAPGAWDKSDKPKLMFTKKSKKVEIAEAACHMGPKDTAGPAARTGAEKVHDDVKNHEKEVLKIMKSNSVTGLGHLIRYKAQVVAGLNITAVFQNIAKKLYTCAKIYKKLDQTSEIKFNQSYTNLSEALKACSFESRLAVAVRAPEPKVSVATPVPVQHRNITGGHTKAKEVTSEHRALFKKMLDAETKTKGMFNGYKMIAFASQTVAGVNYSAVFQKMDKFTCVRFYQHFAAGRAAELTKNFTFKSAKEA